MGGDSRSDALYVEFVESYRAFCRHIGHKLPAAVADSWITWWGPVRLDLRALFDTLQQHGSLDAQTDLHTWQLVSRSINCSNGSSAHQQQQRQQLPVETVRQLFCTHIADFRDYQQVQQLGLDESCRARDQRPQRPQQQKNLRQQQRQQQQHFEGLHSVKLKPTRGSRATRAANRRSRGSASGTASGAAGRAPGSCSAGSSRSRALDLPGRQVPAAAAAAGVRRTGRAGTHAVKTGYVTSEVICDDILSTSSSDSEDSDIDSSTDSEAEYAEHQPVLLGPAHQAELPQLRPRPADPTAAEAKFLTAAVHTPAAWQQQAQQQQQQASPWLALPPGQFHAQWIAASSGAARLQLLQHWLQRMDGAMGQGMAERLGLGLLGFKLQAAWSPQEELLFALGMLEQYRMFRHMHARYLPKRSVHELNGYYYSVWKTRSGRVAEEYALLCEQDGDAVKFRQSLCMRLAAMWDTASMGPIPAAAALPPALAAKVLAKKAAAGPKAAAAARATVGPVPQLCMQRAETAAAAAAAAAPRVAADTGSNAPGGDGISDAAPVAAPENKRRCLQRLTPGAASSGVAAEAAVRSGVVLPTVLTLQGRSSNNSSNASLGVQLEETSCSPPCSPTAAEQQRSSAGCDGGSSWPCISLLDSDSADEAQDAAEAAAAAHNRKRARSSDDSVCDMRMQLPAD